MRHAQILACVLLTAVGTPTWAASLCVNAGVTSCKPSIQAAVAAAGPGDSIAIAPGVYFENVLVPAGKDGLQITGSGTATIVDPDAPLLGSAFDVRSNGVSLKNLTIRNGQNDAVSVSGSASVIQGLHIVGVRNGSGISIAALGTTGHQIIGNDIRGVAAVGIFVQADASIIKSNVVAQCGRGIEALGAGLAVSQNRIQLAFGVGLEVDGTAPLVSGNSVEQADTALVVGADGAAVQGNRLLSGNVGLLVGCDDCSAASASLNTASGFITGMAVTGVGPGLSVRSNRVTDARGTPLTIAGTGVTAALNVVSGGSPGAFSPPQPCVLVTGFEQTLDGNTVTRCGGPGFLVSGNGSLLTRNVATDAGTFGFEVACDVGPCTKNQLVGNKALLTEGQGYGVTGAATVTTLSGNSGTGNRIDFCDTTASSSTSGNAFAGTSTTCDVVQ